MPGELCPHHETNTGRISACEVMNDNHHEMMASFQEQMAANHQEVMSAIREQEKAWRASHEALEKRLSKIEHEITRFKGAGWMLIKVGAAIIGTILAVNGGINLLKGLVKP